MGSSFPITPTPLISSLKICSERKDIFTGMGMHAYVLKHGLLRNDDDDDVSIGNAIISMYVKCGALGKACEMFETLPFSDVVTWNVMISGFTSHGYGDRALSYFDQMQHEAFAPNSITFLSLLKACGSINVPEKGREIHARIAGGSFPLPERHVIWVGNALVDMYAKCGLLGKALEVFDELQTCDVVSWTALIGGYTQHGRDMEALRFYDQMLIQGVLPNVATFVCLLNACFYVGASNQGQKMHSMIVGDKLLSSNIVLGNALIDMYVKFGILGEAREVFDRLVVQDVVSWTTLIMGYVHHGHSEEAMCMFKTMKLKGFSPNVVTYACILKACGSISSLATGREIHVNILSEGLAKKVSIGNALVDMYVKSGLLQKALEMFNELSDRDAISWNTLIVGYVQHGPSEEALRCFKQMQGNGVCPTSVTFVCVLKACANVGDIEEGQRLHLDIVRKGFFETDVTVGNSLVDMYVKCGLVGIARVVFDKLPIKDVVSWNLLITGYIKHGYEEEALNCFDSMQREGIVPDAITHLGTLMGCGRLVAIFKGQETHAEIVKRGLVEEAVNNTLIDMYANCGMLMEAQHVFDSLSSNHHTICSWTSLIAGYAQFGQDRIVHNLFNKMLNEGKGPDPIVFTILLALCSHSGLTDTGQMYFERVIGDYDMLLTLEHHICMIDLLSRAGRLEMVIALIKDLPFCANSTLWHTMLNASQRWGNMELGTLAFQHALQLDVEDASAYVCIRNMYAIQCDTKVLGGELTLIRTQTHRNTLKKKKL